MVRTAGVNMDLDKSIRIFYENMINDKIGSNALGISLRYYSLKRKNMGLKTIVYGKICKDCRCAFVTKLKFQIRCYDCSNTNRQLFLTRKSILFHISEMVKLNLQRAKEYVSMMEQEDPMMLNGIRDLLPEEVR